MNEALLAGVIGLAAGSTLVVGALSAWLFRIPDAVVAGVMAFGAGVLISALAYELVAEANRTGGLGATVGGFLLGALLYVAANALLDRYGADHRRRRVAMSTESAAAAKGKPTSTQAAGAGTAIAVGALLDGIPESLVLGLSVAAGDGFSVPILVAIAISNLPEGLSSSAGMKAAGRTAGYVFGVWGTIAVASGIAAMLGYLFLAAAPAEVIAFVTTIAAGGILAMVCNTMIPEAFEKDRALTGLLVTAGFLAAFVLHELG